MTNISTDSNPKNGLSNSKDDIKNMFLELYQKINAKKQELSKDTKENLTISFNDISELHYKTEQIISSTALNMDTQIGINISIFQSNGEKSTFNSFDDFKRENTTSPSSTSVIVIKYIFSIYDEKLREYENYKVTFKLQSKLAHVEEMQRDAPPFLRDHSFLYVANFTTASITIEHDDYVKARSFVAMFEDWVKGCSKNFPNSTYELLKNYSHFIPPIGNILIVTLLALFINFSFDVKIINVDFPLKFLITYASVLMVFVSATRFFLNKVERHIDSNLTMSYIELSKGDTNLIAKFNKLKNKNVKGLIFSGIGSIIIGVGTRYVYEFINFVIQKN